MVMEPALYSMQSGEALSFAPAATGYGQVGRETIAGMPLGEWTALLACFLGETKEPRINAWIAVSGETLKLRFTCSSIAK